MGTHLPTADELDDICVRFILSLPAIELESFDRLLFNVEQAWWHYEDFVRTAPGNAGRLRSLSMKEFTGLILNMCPGLEAYRSNLEQIYASFNKYKSQIPVCGAILLDPARERCLLVRGWKDATSWGFPRGKMAARESHEQCAIREVLEETGFDIAPRLHPDHFLHVELSEQSTRMYIIDGVDVTTHFAPQVRYEIGAYAWYHVAHLPDTYLQAKGTRRDEGGGKHKFFNVWQYMKPLKAWIAAQQRRETARDSGAAGGVAAAHQTSQHTEHGVMAQVLATSTPPHGSVEKGGGMPVADADAHFIAVPGEVVGQALLNFKFDRGLIMQQYDLAAGVRT